jgi:D-sedoheptulose 7-phosphate isomerase
LEKGPLPKDITINTYLNNVISTLNDIPLDTIARISKQIFDSIISRKLIFVVGNGGSSALAGHFTADLFKLGIEFGISVRAITLGINPAIVSANGNDYNFIEGYGNEIKNLADKNDILFMISSSGTSPNIVHVAKKAKEMKLVCLCLTGFKNSLVEQYCLDGLNLDLEFGQYGEAEDVHGIVLHGIIHELRRLFMERNKS